MISCLSFTSLSLILSSLVFVLRPLPSYSGAGEGLRSYSGRLSAKSPLAILAFTSCSLLFKSAKAPLSSWFTFMLISFASAGGRLSTCPPADKAFLPSLSSPPPPPPPPTSTTCFMAVSSKGSHLLFLFLPLVPASASRPPPLPLVMPTPPSSYVGPRRVSVLSSSSCFTSPRPPPPRPPS